MWRGELKTDDSGFFASWGGPRSSEGHIETLRTKNKRRAAEWLRCGDCHGPRFHESTCSMCKSELYLVECSISGVGMLKTGSFGEAVKAAGAGFRFDTPGASNSVYCGGVKLAQFWRDGRKWFAVDADKFEFSEN